LSNYIAMNAKKGRWQCPICNKRTLTFKKDLFFQELLKGLNRI